MPIRFFSDFVAVNTTSKLTSKRAGAKSDAMQLIELSDAASFLQRSYQLLMESEAENNLLLSSALTLARANTGRSSRLSFYTVEHAGHTVASALNATDRRLLLSSATHEAATHMGEQLARREVAIKGVLGPMIGAEAFSAAFLSASHSASHSASRHVPISEQTQNVLRAESLREPDLAPGLWRPARDKDLKLLIKWSRQFAIESSADETPAETEETVRRYIEAKQIFIWDDQRPVAMAGYAGATPNGIRVNMVFTEPTSRQNGYASSLVYLLSRKLLSKPGRKFCYLFVDAANPTANRVYEKLGYRPISTYRDFRLMP